MGCEVSRLRKLSYFESFPYLYSHPQIGTIKQISLLDVCDSFTLKCGKNLCLLLEGESKGHSFLEEPMKTPLTCCLHSPLVISITVTRVGLEKWLVLKSTDCSSRSWVCLPEPLGKLTIIRNFSSSRSSTLFWPLQVPGMHVVHRYICPRIK